MAPRTDIQALRGIAVLLVILQHARAGYVAAGFLGVDIFFVISGFLITGMLAREVERGGIRFGEFYFRRAKRLLPAAYVTFLVTALLSYYLLDAAEWHDFTRQLAGAVTFTGNFVLMHQTGYFEGAAELKPLLHVWSLAVEEQYYLVLPAAMALLPRRFWFGAAVVVLAASLGLCVWLSSYDPDAAFYLLPTRAWELAIGSLVALWPVRHRRDLAIVSRLFPAALLALVLVPISPLPGPHYVNIGVVCIATAIVIMRRHDVLADRPIPTVLAKVGDASYSLYLVHWPIFAFINNVYAGDPSFGTPEAPVLAAGVVLAMASGFALYRWVELPVRRAQPRARRAWVATALLWSAALALVPFGIAARTNHGPGPRPDPVDYVALRRDNLGFGKACDGYDRFVPSAACSHGGNPATMVWGDSFAMHLVAGIAATSSDGVVQATKSACAPMLGAAQVTGVYNREYAGRCIAFNQSVLDYLAATPSIRVVVLSSPFYPYFDPQRSLLRSVDGRLVEQVPNEGAALEVMQATIARLRAMGKRVVVVAPPPSTGFDYTHCLERKATNRTLFRKFIDCDMPMDQYRASKRQVLDFLDRLGRAADVPVVSFDAFLCDGSKCATQLDGTILYRDEGHLSARGSVVLAQAIGLGALVEREAR